MTDVELERQILEIIEEGSGRISALRPQDKPVLDEGLTRGALGGTLTRGRRETGDGES